LRPSQTGKTDLTLRLIAERERVISKKIEKVVYVFGKDQPRFHKPQYADIEFTPSFPNEEDLTPNSMLIFDDVMTQLESNYNSYITRLVTLSVNHAEVSVIILLHNLYAKNLRSLQLSCQYICFFRQPRDLSTISVLSKQIFPSVKGFLKDCYYFATRKRYSYLFIDIHPSQDQDKIVRTSIFSYDSDCYLLLP